MNKDGSAGVITNALSDDRSYDEAYMQEFAPEDSDEDDVNKKMKM